MLQVRNIKGSAKKPDTQGPDQLFCDANVANGGSEPILTDAAQCSNGTKLRKTVVQPLSDFAASIALIKSLGTFSKSTSDVGDAACCLAK